MAAVQDQLTSPTNTIAPPLLDSDQVRVVVEVRTGDLLTSLRPPITGTTTETAEGDKLAGESLEMKMTEIIAGFQSCLPRPPPPPSPPI